MSVWFTHISELHIIKNNHEGIILKNIKNVGKFVGKYTKRNNLQIFRKQQQQKIFALCAKVESNICSVWTPLKPDLKTPMKYSSEQET